MNTTTIICLGIACVLFISGCIIGLSPGKSNKEKADELKEFPEDYAENFMEAYLKSGKIEDTLTVIFEKYKDVSGMQSQIEMALEYLDGDYGDYETALSLININKLPEVEAVHSEVIRIEVSKKRGLPG